MSINFINQQNTKCTFCGEYLWVRSGCCAHCGHPLPHTNDKKTLKEGIIICSILIAVFILVSLWILF
jgi:hypothetical protein